MRRLFWLAAGALLYGALPHGESDGVRVADCDPSYRGVCIPSGPPDLDCRDVPFSSFGVSGDDPHGFDADGDGIGCEPYRGSR